MHKASFFQLLVISSSKYTCESFNNNKKTIVLTFLVWSIWCLLSCSPCLNFNYDNGTTMTSESMSVSAIVVVEIFCEERKERGNTTNWLTGRPAKREPWSTAAGKLQATPAISKRESKYCTHLNICITAIGIADYGKWCQEACPPKDVKRQGHNNYCHCYTSEKCCTTPYKQNLNLFLCAKIMHKEK